MVRIIASLGYGNGHAGIASTGQLVGDGLGAITWIGLVARVDNVGANGRSLSVGGLQSSGQCPAEDRRNRALAV